MKNSSVLLGSLFKETGFISENNWDILLKNFGGKKKNVGEIFTQDVSLQAFVDLATIEIKIPFSNKTKDTKIQALSHDMQMTTRDLANLLSIKNANLKNSIHLLTTAGLINKENTESILSEFELNKNQGSEFLIESRVLTSELITTYITKKDTDLFLRNRMSVALEILVLNNFVTEDELEKIIKSAGDDKKQIQKLLKEKNKLKEETLVEAITKGMYLPTINLDNLEIDEKCLSFFPVEFLRKQLVLPVKITKDTIHLAITDPLNLTLFDTITFITNLNIKPFYASPGSLINKINMLYSPKEEMVEERKTKVEKQSSASLSDKFGSLVNNASTVQLVSSIIESAIATRATDIHMESQKENMRVRFRIDGSLHNIMSIPTELQLPVLSRIKVLADMNVTERRRPQDGHISFQIGKGNFDLRISSIPTFYGEKIVIRILDESQVKTGMGDLGLESVELEKMEILTHKPYGMILVTGPTGGGKTSTLYAGLSEINKTDINIITIEDPVEYQLSGINQIQVDNKIELTFASGLRSVLRQDPDVVMVGEVRDQETAQIAIRAALTGHLVLSTLHTNTSVGAITTLMHMGIKPYMIASSIIGVVSQRLVKKICENCKTSYKPSAGVLRDLGLDNRSKKPFYKGTGCDKCLNTGYIGRTGIFEVFVISDPIKELIINNPSEQELLRVACEEGMSTLLENGIRKVQAGITTPEEVLRVISL